MAVTISAPGEVAARPPRAVRHTTRKIGFVGSHTASLRTCPWKDPSWELWGHASSRSWYSRELDCYFEMHRKSRWNHTKKKGAKFVHWLGQNTVPIYMHERYPEVPASIRYPRERVFEEFSYLPRRYFTNTVAWMAALAIMEGATTVGLWGVSYSTEQEFFSQRGSMEFWLGVMGGKGIHVILPDECKLLADPVLLYGYESHDEKGVLVPEYQPKVFKPGETPKRVLKPGEKPPELVIPPDLQREIDEEEALIERPDWAKPEVA